MGKEVPKLNDEMLCIDAAERTLYWCNVAMVRADYHGKGIAKALFQLAFEEAEKMGWSVGLGTTNPCNVSRAKIRLWDSRTWNSYHSRS